MKKILIGIFSLILIANIANAQKTITKDQVLSEMAKVGVTHNQTLDYFYNQLAAKGAISNDVIKTVAGTILVNIPENPSSSYLLDKGTSNIFVDNFNTAHVNLLQSQDISSTKSYVEVTLDKAKLTPDEQAYVTNLMGIVARNEKDIPALEKEVTTFNESVLQKFGINSNSTAMLIAASSVAKSSASYWLANSAKWVSLANPKGLTNGKAACCGGVVTADVAGAVGGGLGGAAAGAMAGGIGAVPGAAAGAVGGAIAGSVGQGVINLIHWLWK